MGHARVRAGYVVLFVKAFAGTYRRPIPWDTATYAAAAADLLLDAIARSDGTRNSINKELRTTDDPHSILGPIRFDHNGDPTTSPVTIYRIGHADGRSTPTYPWLPGAHVDRIITARDSLVAG